MPSGTENVEILHDLRSVMSGVATRQIEIIKGVAPDFAEGVIEDYVQHFIEPSDRWSECGHGDAVIDEIEAACERHPDWQFLEHVIDVVGHAALHCGSLVHAADQLSRLSRLDVWAWASAVADGRCHECGSRMDGNTCAECGA